MVYKFLQEDDATLNERSGGVLNNTNSLYNWFDQRKSIEKKSFRSEDSKVVLNNTNLLYNQLKSMLFNMSEM